MLTFFGLLIVVVLSFFIFFLSLFVVPVIKQPDGVRFTVLPGSSFSTVVTALEQEKIISHPWLFELLIALRNKEHQLKAGEYFFPKGMTAARLLTHITTGKGIIYHSFIILPGSTFSAIRAALNSETNLKHLTSSLTEAEIMQRLGGENLSAEGLFFPDTYFFIKGSTDFELLKRAYLRMQKKLAAEWQQRDVTIPYPSSYEALIAASIIEKEARVASDRPLIASVIINRMAKNMLLQMDPTVIYGLGDRYTGKIFQKDLKEKTAYNTYRKKGLPPTPIAMPSLNSLHATLHPAATNYLYFVAKEDGSGAHQFSENLIQHHTAVTEAKSRLSVLDFFNEARTQLYLQHYLSLKEPHA